MKKRPLVITGIAVMLLAAALCCFWFISKRQSVHLPGGGEIALVAVTQGPTNVFVPGSLWDKLVYRWVPARGMTIAGFTLRPVSPLRVDGFYQDGTIAEPRKAVVWVSHYGETNARGFPMGWPQKATTELTFFRDWFHDIRAEVLMRVTKNGRCARATPNSSQYSRRG